MDDTTSTNSPVALKVLPRYNFSMVNARKGDIELGKRIKLARGKMTQEELAEKSGVSLSMIQKMEVGRLFGAKETHTRLAKALNITEAYLVYGQEKPKSRIPDLPPDDPPLSQEKLDLLNDPRIGLMFSRNTLGQLSNRQLNQLVSQIEFFLEENEELKRLIRGNKQDGTSN